MTVIEINKSNDWTRVLTEAIWFLVYPICVFVLKLRLLISESDNSGAKEPYALSGSP